jgi:hypothetical protein
MIIKKHHILKCLNKKKENFKVVVQEASEEQLQESMKSNNIDFDMNIEGLNYTLLHKLEGTNATHRDSKNKR